LTKVKAKAISECKEDGADATMEVVKTREGVPFSDFILFIQSSN